MKRILSQCVKELAQFQRDRLTLALAFLLPFMTLLIFGFAIRLEAKNIPLIVRDQDNSYLSRGYTDSLFATNQFTPAQCGFRGFGCEHGNINLVQPEKLIDSGIAKAAVIIPPEFSRQIKSNKVGNVQVLVDGTDVNNARIIQNTIQATTNSYLQSAGLLPTSNNLVAHIRLWFNPGRKESLYIVPGVYALVLWIFPGLLTAIAMVREKEKGTILQVYASSLSATELLLGKGLAYTIVAFCEAVFIILSGSAIFSLSFATEPTSFLIGTMLYLTTSVAFGLLIGVRAKVQNEAVQIVALIGFLSALLLSGMIYPLSNIPFPLSLLPNIVPPRYFIDITRDAFVRGTGWPGVWFAELMLFVLAMVFFNVARRVLSRMQLPD